MAAQGNIQVCYFSNAKQLFHALRRQVLRDYRKPLIVMTPKSFLRNPRASASFSDLSSGHFEEVLADPREELKADKVTRVIMCTGKVAHDALDTAEKSPEKLKINDTAIVRIEQLSPFPSEQLERVIRKYPKAQFFAWAQEEPRNMGAASYVLPKIERVVGSVNAKAKLNYIGRSERGSPAVGLEKRHLTEQQKLIEALWTASGATEI